MKRAGLLALSLAGMAGASGGGHAHSSWISPPRPGVQNRWQRSLGQPQKYGTQYLGVGEGCQFELEPYDPATTDQDRAKYDVPPLTEALAQADEINAECRKNQAP